MISRDVLFLAADHLKPSCPQEYCKYAEVNHDFYSVFTSDTLWYKFNMYNLESGIYRDFCRAAAKDPCLMRFAWTDHGFPTYPEEKLGLSIEKIGLKCRYAKLGRLVTAMFQLGKPIGDRDLVIKSFFFFDHSIWFDLDPELACDHEVGLAACKSHGANLRWLSETLHDDKEIALAALGKWDHAADRWGYDMFERLSPRLQEDTDVVLKAIGLAVYKLPESIQKNEKLIKYAVSRYVATYIGYWVPEDVYNELEVSFKRMAGDYGVYEIGTPRTLFNDNPDTVEIYVGEKELDDIDWLLNVVKDVKDSTGWLQAQYDELMKDGPYLKG